MAGARLLAHKQGQVNKSQKIFFGIWGVRLTFWREFAGKVYGVGEMREKLREKEAGVAWFCDR